MCVFDWKDATNDDASLRTNMVFSVLSVGFQRKRIVEMGKEEYVTGSFLDNTFFWFGSDRKEKIQHCYQKTLDTRVPTNIYWVRAMRVPLPFFFSRLDPRNRSESEMIGRDRRSETQRQSPFIFCRKANGVPRSVLSCVKKPARGHSWKEPVTRWRKVTERWRREEHFIDGSDAKWLGFWGKRRTCPGHNNVVLSRVTLKYS